VIGSLSDPETTLAGLEAWGIHMTGLCQLYLFPGDHFFILKQAARD
jgi:surfactin synthase thioesterase subunit